MQRCCLVEKTRRHKKAEAVGTDAVSEGDDAKAFGVESGIV